MPAHTNPLRAGSKPDRVQKLMQASADEVSLKRPNQTWTEYARSWFSWITSFLSSSTSKAASKVGAPTASGFTGDVAKDWIKWGGVGAVTYFTGPLGLIGSALAYASVEACWSQVEDQIKETMASEWDRLSETGHHSQVVQEKINVARQSSAEWKPEEAVQEVVQGAGTLAKQLAQLQQQIQNGAVNYCDDLHALALSFYQLSETQRQLAGEIDLLVTFLTNLKDAVGAQRFATVEQAIKSKIEHEIDQGRMWHNQGSYVYAAWSCSSKHCFGPKA